MVMRGEKPKYWERNLSHGHFSHRNTEMDWSGNKHEPPRSQVSNTPTDVHGTALAVWSAVRTTIMQPVVLYQLDNAR